MQWVKASKLQELLGEGFSSSTIKRRRQDGTWKEGKHYRVITPLTASTPRFQYNVKAIEKELNKPESARR